MTERRAAPRPAAVLILIDETEGEPRLIFVQRSEEVPSHKGQIAFPGGTHRPSDESLLATALREANEELALPPDAVEVLAELPEHLTANSNFAIRPFLARLRRPVALDPDGWEVVAVLRVPLAALLADDAARDEEWDWQGGRRVFWVYRYGDHVIWGATARILRGLLESGLMRDYGAPSIPGPAE